MRTFPIALALAGPAAAQPVATPAPPERTYFVAVVSEAVDQIAVVRFGPGGIAVDRQRYIGLSLTEQMGPHGIAFTPDKSKYFVTTAHGKPNGHLRRFDTATEAYQGRVELGMFPATVQVSPDGYYVYISNFNLWGPAAASSISVVSAADLTEIAQIDTCVMPHGSRFTRDGKRHYSTCMMSDVLVEIDTRRLEVARHLTLAAGREVGKDGPPVVAADTTRHHAGAHALNAPSPNDGTCQPTWAEPSADGASIWVACSKSSELVEVDAVRWAVKSRIAAGPGIYNLAVSRDGRRLVATNRRDQSISVFDAITGRELARIATTRKMVSGVVVSDDDRYAFVTAEGSGGAGEQSGSVDVIDLRALVRVASLPVGAQAGGIDFWKSVP